MKQPTLLLVAVGSAAAFTGMPLVPRTVSRSSCLYMGGAQGIATSPDGKKATVERVKGLLDSSEMIFTVPGGSITVAESEVLRRALPESTTMMTVKNTLMNRALEGSEFADAASMLKGPNTWFFIEEDIKGTVESYKKFSKDYDKDESHPILGGVLEGVAYDTEGVEAISKLPSKLELIAQIASGIKAVPTRVARVIKAPNTKLARAIKLATAEEKKE